METIKERIRRWRLRATLCLGIALGSPMVWAGITPQVLSFKDTGKSLKIELSDGSLNLTPMAENAVRVQFQKESVRKMPEWVYVKQDGSHPTYHIKDDKRTITLQLGQMTVEIDKQSSRVNYYDGAGQLVLAELGRNLLPSLIQGEKTYCAEQHFESPKDEALYGLGQFQDGYLNVRGLTRRLTQVNTQIAIPFYLSSKGYGMLWNNYGLTDFNPCSASVKLSKEDFVGKKEMVDVTTFEGVRQELREPNRFSSTMDVPVSGKYAILLDVGQSMARAHHLQIDGKDVINFRNFWLPPTASVIVDLEAGTHHLMAELEKNDQPVVYYKLVDDQTVLRSPVAECVDFTVFTGNADQVIASYRELTGQAPMMPRWAMGYIHCRERFHSQDELLETAKRFRKERIPLDLIVQDWQYWGRYGWNSMRFDEKDYPNPKAMVKSLHDMDIRLMISVWSKIDLNSEVGKRMNNSGYFIPQTSWVDFFNPKAAASYWENFSNGLLKPYGIDAWWQDATEPENDDLKGRRIQNALTPGEVFRNTYPLLVNKTVYEGCRADNPSSRAMILTRSGFPGMQRYAAATWSGDVGNDWETLRRQITGGLSQMASGLPWWTYDAGGFFRPGKTQYTDKAYQQRFLRWLQAGVFLPMLRVHGFQTDTEFWNYGPEVTRIARVSLNLRYRLLPYIYSEAANVTFKAGTMMRPLMMDFVEDPEALAQNYEYMFGPSILVAPIVEEEPQTWPVYLPNHQGGWYDFWTGQHSSGQKLIEVPVSDEHIPLFVKAGSILPLGKAVQHTGESLDAPWEIRIYPGADAHYTVYEDEGSNYNYEQGKYSTYDLSWDDKKQVLTISDRKGSFEGMVAKRILNIVKVDTGRGVGLDAGKVNRKINYSGKAMQVQL